MICCSVCLCDIVTHISYTGLGTKIRGSQLRLLSPEKHLAGFENYESRRNKTDCQLFCIPSLPMTDLSSRVSITFFSSFFYTLVSLLQSLWLCIITKTDLTRLRTAPPSRRCACDASSVVVFLHPDPIGRGRQPPTGIHSLCKYLRLSCLPRDCPSLWDGRYSSSNRVV